MEEGYKPNFSIDEYLLEDALNYAKYLYNKYRKNLNSRANGDLLAAVRNLQDLVEVTREPKHKFWPLIDPNTLVDAETAVNLHFGKFVYSLMFKGQDNEEISHIKETFDRVGKALKGTVYADMETWFNYYCKKEVTISP